MKQSLIHMPLWFWSLTTVAASLAVALFTHRIFFALAKRLTARTKSSIDNSLARHSEKPMRLILLFFAVLVVLPITTIPARIEEPVRHIVGLGLIASFGWLLIALIDVFDDLVTIRHSVEVRDNLSARRIRTQVEVLRRIAVSGIIVITIAIMLMTFPSIRHLGEGLFASAGVAALVAGLAARSTMSNLIAGLQVALTQPIRLDDVVIVEGEWGRIEEISTTYVVVCIWDLRRLVVPLSYFIEKPFQNWTRSTADLLGTVFVYTDYTVPVEMVRAELHRILQASGMWDEKVWGLQVTNATERTLELRALMSAADSSTAWDLRCHVREQLVRFLQQDCPQGLPKMRAEIQRSDLSGIGVHEGLAVSKVS